MVVIWEGALLLAGARREAGTRSDLRGVIDVVWGRSLGGIIPLFMFMSVYLYDSLGRHWALAD